MICSLLRSGWCCQLMDSHSVWFFRIEEKSVAKTLYNCYTDNVFNNYRIIYIYVCKPVFVTLANSVTLNTGKGRVWAQICKGYILMCALTEKDFILISFTFNTHYFDSVPFLIPLSSKFWILQGFDSFKFATHRAIKVT